MKKPADISFDEAASVSFGGTTALYFLRDVAKLQAGQKILVIGASGGTGVYAVQLAKYYGAVVTGVCSTTNLELVRSLGADKVVDYTRQDFTQNGETYDVILDMVPGQSAFARYQVLLKPDGLYLAGAGGLKAFAQMAWTSLTGGYKVIAAMAPDRREDLVFLNELLEAMTPGEEGKTLAQLCARRGLKRARCTTLLGASDYQLLLTEAPDVGPDELKKALRWKIKA